MRTRLLIPIIFLIALLGVDAAQAQLQPSSEVLLPYFEVDLKDGGKTTLLAVGNALGQPVEGQIEIRTNWGIPISTLNVTWEPHEMKSFNLRDWIVQGKMPNRALRVAEKNQMKAALTGQRSPKDNLFYSSAAAPELAVGSVIIRTTGDRPDALWGDYLLVDPSQSVSMGDTLVNLDRSSDCQGTEGSLCLRHALRFLDGLEVDADTEVVFWAKRSAPPSQSAYPEALKLVARAGVYDESGKHIEDREIRFTPLQVVTLGSLGLSEPFGWIDLKTDVPVFIAVQYNRARHDSATLQAYCLPPLLPPPPDPETPGLDIEKRTNGHDADTAPGPKVPVGSAVTWEYIVRNTGEVTLTDVKVSDDQGVQVTCPKATLEAGEIMTCTGHGTAQACQYRNIGSVVGTTPGGDELTAQDPSHYFGDQNARIDIETAVNGQDADNPNGPTLSVGAAVSWTYGVTNTGDVNLTGIVVVDDKGVAVTCPKTSLHPGESMTCSANGTAAEGLYRNVGAVTAKASCGPDVQDSDPSHYFGERKPDDPKPRISLKKYTNGHDADTAPGPKLTVGSAVLWTYIVTNSGEVNLSNVKVTDDRGVLVTCPKTSLQSGESMTCSGNGTATAGQYKNIGSVVGTPPSGPNVTASDPSHYYGEQPPPGTQGCTPGYWKNHTDSWAAAGYNPATKVQNVFSQASGYPSLGSASLLDALSFHGGSSIDGAAGNLLRAAVAGLLDASHPGVDYPRNPASVISDVNAALASRDRDTILGLASRIDADNNLGCPLN